MNYQLLIENMEVELDKSVSLALTKEFADLSNVTDIINTWSKTVQIPFSETNNAIFGHIFQPDKVINKDANKLPVGFYIDTSRKLEFKLLYNGGLMMNGYAKVNGSTLKSGKGVYNINLFGQLGAVFKELKQLTFDKNNEDIAEKYKILDYFTAVMNKELIKECWSKSFDDLDFWGESGEALDFIGFAPTNSGLNKDFKSDTFEEDERKKTSIKDYLEREYPNRWGEESTTNHYDIDSAIGDGIKPLAMGEYRSYNTQPYVYVHKLFNILKRYCYQLTGYSLDFDVSWFNKENPYYGRMVMLLKSFGNESIVYENTLGTKMVGDAITFNATYSAGSGPDKGLDGLSGLESQDLTSPKEVKLYYDEDTSSINQNTQIVDFQGNTQKIITSDEYGLYANGSAQVNIKLTGGGNRFYLGEKSILTLRWAFVGANGTLQTYDNFIFSTETTIGEDQVGEDEPYKTIEEYINHFYPEPIFIGECPYRGSSEGYSWYVSVPFGQKLNKTTFGDWVKVSLVAMYTFDNGTAPFVQYDEDGDIYCGWYYPHTISFGSNVFSMGASADAGNKRTGDIFTLGDLWDNNVSLLEVCLRYTKMYNLIWHIDDVEKTISVMPRYKYFQMSEGHKNWTEKLDMTNDYNINPLLWDALYAHFNYEDSKTSIGDDFLSRKGYNWGDKKLKLQYEFNNESNKLFDGLPCSITSTDTVLPFTRLANQNFVFVGCDCPMPNLESDGQPVDGFGQFYFFSGLKAFDTNLDDIYITDDSSFQMSTNDYCYLAPGSQFTNLRVKATKYPCLNIAYNKNLCVFAKPSITYDSTTKYEDCTDLYTNIWQKYMEGELYNAQNKKITCYLDLRAIDMINFYHYDMVVIDNQLYMVNKIYDFDLSTDNTTKVDLIRVDDVNNYKSINYQGYNYFLPEHYTKIINGGDTLIEIGVKNTFSSVSVVNVGDNRWSASYSNGKISIVRNALVPITASYEFNVTLFCTTGGDATLVKIMVIVRGADPVPVVTYDYIFEADELDGSNTQGTEWDLKPFSTDETNWTLFTYAYSSENPNTDTNATLVQCVVNASPWSGFRVDADNTSYPKDSTEQSTLIPRLTLGADNWFNTVDMTRTGSRTKFDVDADKHPFCLSRSGSDFFYSFDGTTWTKLAITQAQVDRLVDAIVTIGYDYKRASGKITTTRYRFLKTSKPCCVAFKRESGFNFSALFKKYDHTI